MTAIYTVQTPRSSLGDDLKDLEQSEGIEAVREFITASQHKPAKPRFSIQFANDISRIPLAKFRVKHVLPAEGIAAIFGPSGSGKTFLEMLLAFCIASGETFFGKRTVACDVLLVVQEGVAGLPQRIQACQQEFGAVSRIKFLTNPLSLLAPEDVEDLIVAIKASGFSDGVIFIDTFAAAAPGMDENASGPMGLAIAAIKRIQSECGGLVVLVHHSGKDITRGLRGHSSLHAALDAVIEVSRDGDRREWKLSKSKDGADGDAFPFELEIVELGTDEDGDPITSCTVKTVQTSADDLRRVLPPKSGNQRLVFDGINDALKTSSHYGMAGAAPTRPCLSIDDAIAAGARRLACEPKRQRERAQQAITGLVARKNLVLREGWLWLP